MAADGLLAECRSPQPLLPEIAVDPEFFAPAGRQIGRYQIIREIGQGVSFDFSFPVWADGISLQPAGTSVPRIVDPSEGPTNLDFEGTD